VPARVYATEAIILGPAASKTFELLSARLSPWLSGPLTFMLVLLAGDLLLVILLPKRAESYLEKVLIDTFMFGILGLLAAVTYQAAELHLAVKPNLGPVAVLVFLLFLSISEDTSR